MTDYSDLCAESMKGHVYTVNTLPAVIPGQVHTYPPRYDTTTTHNFANRGLRGKQWWHGGCDHHDKKHQAAPCNLVQTLSRMSLAVLPSAVPAA